MRMVLLKATPTIQAALHGLSPSARDELSLPETLQLGAPIAHEQLISLARAYTSDTSNTSYQNASRNTYTLERLLRGTDLYIPPPPPKPEPTPEYLALKARLQSLAEQQAYNQLIAPSSLRDNPYRPSPVFSSAANDLLNAETNADNDPLSPSLVINIFMSVLLCGFATFWALKNFQTPSFLRFGSRPAAALPLAGTSAQSEPVFVLISLFVGLLVGVAEVVVYASYLRKVRQARAAEGKIKEKREVVPLEGAEAPPEAPPGCDDSEEKEEIWGKGVNGGVRRRVKERWEGRT